MEEEPAVKTWSYRHYVVVVPMVSIMLICVAGILIGDMLSHVCMKLEAWAGEC